MLGTLLYAWVFRKFSNEDLLETIEVLNSRRLWYVDGAIMQAKSQYLILRELKRRGIKELE